MDKIILSIVQPILCPLHVGDIEDFSVKQTSDILYRKINNMPILLRTAVTVLIYLYALYGVALTLFSLKQQTFERHQKQLLLWQKSPLNFCREAMSFFTKMTLFIYFSICQKNI